MCGAPSAASQPPHGVYLRAMGALEPDQPSAVAARSPLQRDQFPLQGSSVVVTGVSRRAGIGYAIACRMAAYGANVWCHHFSPHDDDQPWGSDAIDEVIEGIRAHLRPGAEVAHFSADLRDPQAPQQIMDAAVAAFGHVDALVCNQAVSGSDSTLNELTAEMLDHHWQLNARASILLTQAFAHQHDSSIPGSVVLMTSGQNLGPMPAEVCYATSKAAVAGITATLSDHLADRNIRLNTVNPGPVDTGYLTPAGVTQVQKMFPQGRVGQPDDPARLIAWLCTEEAAWITGQTINSEGGFRR